MSYSLPNFETCAIALLAAKGYEVHEGSGDQPDTDGFWFTYLPPNGRGDVVSGPTFHTETAAWVSALDDYFSNTHMPLEDPP